MDKLNSKQKLAFKYYKAYGNLCSDVDEAKEYSHDELVELRLLRGFLHSMYKKYDSDNSFDLSKYHRLG